MNTEVILGAGGTGKTTKVRERIESDPQYALLTASTGIAAVNLGEGVATVHSSLGFFDTRSAFEALKHGTIANRAYALAKAGKKNVLIDEVSTIGADMLQCIYDGFEQAEERCRDKRIEPTGLILVGDMLQLGPIPDNPKEKGKYPFQAPCWDKFAGNMTQLKTVYRQSNPAFLEALQLIRAGRGVDGALALQKLGVEFVTECDDHYDGITLFPTNKQVEFYNEKRLAELPGDDICIHSERWGTPRSEWKNIPEVLRLRENALVMVLANYPKTFDYVNGDLGDFYTKMVPDGFGGERLKYQVRTKRGYDGDMDFVIRRNVVYEDNSQLQAARKMYLDSSWDVQLNEADEKGRPDQWMAIYMGYMDAHTMLNKPYYDPKNKGLVIGEVEYMPLRLAYGSSYNKVQGLTLDKCQVDIRHYWAGNPGMVYVALTRVRSVEGLRIVGDVRTLAKRTCTDARVRGYV